MFQFELGIKVSDQITKFSGIVTGRCDYVTGCNTYLVQPPVKNGAHVESRWFDENRLKRVGKTKITLKTEEPEEKGACEPAPIK